MTAEAITVDSTFFRPIRVTEEIMEGLISTAASGLFPGFDYFVFRPAIRSGASTRHPDGALLSRDDSTWWVVEVESHLHSVDDHIEPQLNELATGFYGPDAFGYLKRHLTFDAANYNIDLYEPSFLLVIDSLTPQIRDAAIRNGFETLECGPFRSERNEYALVVSGFRPRRDLAPTGPGLTLTLTEESGMAVLCPLDGGRVPALPTDDVIVADIVYKSFVRSDSGAIVLPLTADELRALLDGAGNFRLASSGQLFALPDVTTTIPVKE